MERVIARIAEEPHNKGNPVRRFAISSALRTLQDASVIDPGADALIAALSPQVRGETAVDTSEASTLDLDAEWTVQAARLADLFASELGMSRDEYAASLPRFAPQPESYKGRLDIPLIVPVHPTLGVERTARIAGIASYYDADSIKDWKDHCRGFATPQVPYTTWVDDGSRSLGMSVDAVRENLAVDERGGSVHDGIALYLKNLDLLKQHNLDLPGSRVGSDRAPDLFLWCGGPRLGDRWSGFADPRFGSVRAGREINTQPLTS